MAAIRLGEFALNVLQIGDGHGWDVAEIYENLAVQSVIDNEKFDEPALVQSAIGQAAAPEGGSPPFFFFFFELVSDTTRGRGNDGGGG